jgi:hypothetical protein
MRKPTVSASDGAMRIGAFYARYCFIVLGLGIALRLVLVIESAGSGDFGLNQNDIVLLLWGLVPYVLLVALARRIGSRAVLVVAAAFFLLTDAIACWGATSPGSSTDVVALAFQPLYAIVLGIPLALLAGYAVRTYR